MTVPGIYSFKTIISLINDVDRSSIEVFNFKNSKDKRLRQLHEIMNIFNVYVERISKENKYDYQSNSIARRNVSNELSLTLNDFLTKILFLKIKKLKSYIEVLNYKKTISASTLNDIEYLELFYKIRSSLLELFNFKKFSFKWIVRAYRVLYPNEIALCVNSDLIVTNAKEVLKNKKIPSKEITPRYLDTLCAAQLILERASNILDLEPWQKLPFDPVSFESGNAEYRASICSKYSEQLTSNDF